jgi:hypothetical protein
VDAEPAELAPLIDGRVRLQPDPQLKVAAVSGFLMTLLFVTLSIVPIIQVSSRLAFALKITALIVVTNLIGLAIFRRARK